ncbi:MAG: SRPBCC domain-containing protein [Gammaproteobacteria bacterium]|nr:SRPBCC domain-containing protein [Gammaproteobacteria bacterium]
MKIKKTKAFNASVDVVWDAITDEKKLSEWFMKARFQPEVGYQFEFQDTPRGKWDGRLWGEVLVVEPLQRLSYTWMGNQMKHNTQVTWVLKPTVSGTELTLEHIGFKGFGDHVIGFFHLLGWRQYLRGLTNFLRS